MSDVTKTVRDINELKKVAQTACTIFLDECKKAGLDIFITETYRSQARQNYLYEQGRTRPGDKVTWTRNSRHTSRLAWDIACNKPSLYDIPTLEKAGQVARKLGITWGGDWKDVDRPHFEITATWKIPEWYNMVKDGENDMKEDFFVPSSSTLKSEFVKFLEGAKKEGIISSGEWIIKAKEGRLLQSDATALIASYITRKENKK